MKTLSIVALTVLHTVTALPGATSYDLTNSFSTLQNPNGAWSYDVNGIPITPVRSDLDLVGWDPIGNWDGAVAQVVSVRPVIGWNDAQVGDIVIHSWSASGSGAITWTSPGNGTIDITGSTWDALHFVDRDSSWTLALDGVVLAERGTIRGTARNAPEAPFGANVVPGPGLTGLAVSAGDVLSFTPEKTPASPFGHILGIDMNVTYIPEPSVPALGLLFASITVMRRRRSEAVA